MTGSPDAVPRWRRALLHPLPHAVALGVATALVAARSLLMLSPLGLRNPLFGESDELQHVLLVDAMQKHGWYMVNPSLGAPHTMDLHDFPLGGDNFNLFLLKLVSLLPVGPFTGANLFLLASFAMVAGVTFCVLQAIGVRRWTASVAAALYSLLPYHFARGLPHLLLSNYIAAPLCLLLLHWLVQDGLLPPSPSRRRLVGLGAVVLVAGCASPYYAVFTALLLVTGGLLEAARRRSWRPAVAAVLVSGAIGAVLVVNLLPNVLNDIREGDNIEAAARNPADSETYGLRIAGMFTPGERHRIGWFQGVGDEVERVAQPSEVGKYVGVVAGTGIVGLLLLALARAAGARTDGVPPLLPVLGAVSIVGLLVATKGGVSLLIAVLVSSQIRAWNRLEIFVALFGLLFLAVAHDTWVEPRLPRLARLVRPGLLGLVLLVGLFDQLPFDVRRPADVVETGLQVEARYVADMEATLPPGALVYQLPYMRYPGSDAIAGVNVDNHFRLALVDRADALHFSFGAMRGRDADWQEPLIGLAPGEQATLLAAAGFDAISLDTAGYADPAEVSRAIAAVTGPAAGRSEGGRYVWFDLRDLRSEVQAGFDDPDLVAEALTSPPVAGWTSGAALSDNQYPAARALGARSVLRLRNRFDEVVPVRLGGRIDAPAGTGIEVVVGDRRFAVEPGVPLDVAFDLPPGTTEVVVEVDGGQLALPGDTRDVRATEVGVFPVDRRSDPAWALLDATD